MSVAVTVSAASAAAGRPAPLRVGEVRHGFAVTDVTDLPEVGARLWRLTFALNGAELAWLARADDNKTFGISFRTLPSDDTGVAHILEHSVLCGSAKYPVKEPFVDLLKSSLATFLNAFTSKDQTVYPVSSRNDRDFSNLVDVYLDAVFHPRSVETPEMFRQEGWHYEFAPDGALVRNGVVYNEMKGVYANPESIAFREICRLLFPDTVYRFDSGGHPEAIGTLTFEQYCAFYRAHYHPSNARIFLDGAVDIDRVLAQLEGYLKAFPPRDVPPCPTAQAPVARRTTVPYAIGRGESPSGKTLVADAWVTGDFNATARLLACDVLAEALAGSNEAPLKKALLEKGLCADLALETFGFRQHVLFLFAKNVPDGRADELRATVRATLASLAQQGLDRARLAAILDRLEFRTRELFSGGGTCGIQFLERAFDQWLYGGDPAAAFRTAGDFADLRAKLATGWFERFLAETLLANAHHAELTLVPSTELAAQREADEKAALAATLAGWDEAARARVRAETAAVDAFRNKVDTPEELATLPTLALADIPLEGKARGATEETCEGVTVVRPTAGAKGVFYLSLRFAVDDFTLEEMAYLPLLATVLGELATARYSPIELRNALDAGLGRFETSVKTYAARPGDTRTARTVFAVDVAALETKASVAAGLVPEVLLRTQFTDARAMADLLRQERLARERACTTIAARLVARRRAAASFSAKGAVEETLDGLAQLRHLQRAAADAAVRPDALGVTLARLAARVFTRRRLCVYLSDNLAPGADLARLVAAFPEGVCAAPVVHAAFPRRNEGFTVASESAYAARGAHLAQAGAAASGSACVAARLLSLTYLWDEIRVKGGAYGGGLQVAMDGHLGFLSWRDPQPARSLDCYAQAAAALHRFAAGDEALDRYIVGTLGAADPCLTPREEVALAADLRTGGRTYADLQRVRREILATTKADLVAFADVLARLDAAPAVCVIGGAAGVASCSNRLETVESVVPDAPAEK